jgi:hypothetical protein
MAYEPSEILTATALTYSNKELDEASKSYESLVNLMIDIKKKVNKTSFNMLEYGNGTIRKGFTDLINEKDSKRISDLAVGISAAKGLREYSNKESVATSQRIYLTGNVLPDDVKKFQVSAFGMKDYNSADLIYTRDKKVFYGISLKKKPKPTAPSPTLINKAFDSILIGKQFDKIKKELVDIRTKYFSDIVIEAVQKGIIRKSDIKDFDKLKNNNRKELFEAKNRDKKIFDKTYIDTKGYYKAKGGYKDPNTNDPKSMRYFVNRKLAEKYNKLYSAFLKVMNNNAQLFADSLLNLILKTKLYDKLDVKELQKYQFNFALVTGIAEVNENKNTVNIYRASVLPLETTLCGLTRLEEMFKNKKYEIIIDKNKSASSKAAKIYLKLIRGNITLLDLEIRYKGAFTSQPQFQATLNDQYKKLLEKECGV